MRLRMELFVADIERTVAFYASVLGFAVVRRSPGYVSIRRGSVVLGLGTEDKLREPGGWAGTGASGGTKGYAVEIVLEVDGGPEAVDAMAAAVVDGGTALVEPPQDRPWGLRDFRITDPDGYYLRVTHGDARDESAGP